MKAFTDIKQSKKLVEFLPIESADMYYPYVLPKSDRIKHNPEIGNPVNALKWYNKGYTTSGKEPITLDEYCIPCWSLASLFNYMREIEYFPDILADEHNVKMSVIYYDDEEGTILHTLHNISVEEETFVDAAVNLIVKLKEMGLI